MAVKAEMHNENLVWRQWKDLSRIA